MRFAEVIGQPAALRLLARLVERGRVPHAVLLCGPPGCGRRTLARALAQALLCARPQSGDACGACPQCTAMADGSHPDFAELPNDHEPPPPHLLELAGDGVSSAVGKTLPIRWMRELVAEPAYESPLLAARRVFLVPGIDLERLHGPSANALLKVLEEPPAATHLILTARGPENVLPTIRSRVQSFRLQPLAAEDLARVLAARGVPPGEAARRAATGGGSHRELWGDAEAPPFDELRALLEGFSLEAVAAVCARLEQAASASGEGAGAAQRQLLGRWLSGLEQHLRGDLRGPQAAWAADRIVLLEQARRDLAWNIQPRLVLEGIAARG